MAVGPKRGCAALGDEEPSWDGENARKRSVRRVGARGDRLGISAPRSGRPVLAAPGTAWRRGPIPPPRCCLQRLFSRSRPRPAPSKVFLLRRSRELHSVPGSLRGQGGRRARLNALRGFRRLQVHWETRWWGPSGEDLTEGICALALSLSHGLGEGTGTRRP